MRYWEDLLPLQTFSIGDLVVITGNKNTAKSVLLRMLNKGVVKKICHGYYALVSMEGRGVLANSYVIGSRMRKDAAIVFHTAFEYYGMINQVYERVYVSTKTPFREFSFEGVTYEAVNLKHNWGIVTDGNIRVSDIERTILDNLWGLGKYIGLDELVECLSFVTIVDEKKMLEYMKLYGNQFLYQKAGCLLAYFPSMNLSEMFFEECRKQVGKSVRYLYLGLDEQQNYFNKDWKLVLPIKMQEWEDF